MQTAIAFHKFFRKLKDMTRARGSRRTAIESIIRFRRSPSIDAPPRYASVRRTRSGAGPTRIAPTLEMPGPGVAESRWRLPPQAPMVTNATGEHFDLSAANSAMRDDRENERWMRIMHAFRGC
jgi:hypothetical protein